MSETDETDWVEVVFWSDGMVKCSTIARRGSRQHRLAQMQLVAYWGLFYAAVIFVVVGTILSVHNKGILGL